MIAAVIFDMDGLVLDSLAQFSLTTITGLSGQTLT
jgi:beta-phosphoglucomutase-like phosphatase (HAD superfamily)